MASLFDFRKPRGAGTMPPSGVGPKAVTAIAALLLAFGIGSFFKEYYLDNWRLGAYKPPREVRHFLKSHVKSDALIYFDVFPASHLISIINPLDRQMKPEEILHIIRRRFPAGAGEHRYLLYRINKMEYGDYVSFHRADVWAVFPADAVNPAPLLIKAEESSDFNAFPLEKWTILHFKSPEKNIREKMVQMAELLLDLPVDPSRKRHYHLLAAKTFLSVYDAEDAYRHLDAFRITPMDGPGGDFGPYPFTYRILDKVFGLEPRKVKSAGEEAILDEIQRLIFRFGNYYDDMGDTEKALKAYERCSRIGNEFNVRIANRISGMAARAISEGNLAQAIPFWKKALDFNADRKDIRLLLAEFYRREGRIHDAADMYRRVFDVEALPDRFFNVAADEGSAVIIWGENTVRHILFLGRGEEGDEESLFLGGFVADRKIRNVRGIALERRDTMDFLGKKGRLELRVKPGQAKALSLTAPSRSRVIWNLRINGRRDSSRIVSLE